MATHSSILAWKIPWTEETGRPLRGEGCCGVSGASRDSAEVGAMEEGLISRGGTG